MNGRVYDPEIGRFLSADPFIQDATNSQALNAYSYVLNNPLSFTDPSGFFFSKLFRAIGNFFKAIGRAFVSALKAIAKSTIGRAILQIVACAPGPWAPVTCAAAAAGLTIASGGSIKQALLAAAISFAQIAPGGIWDTVGTIVASSQTGLIGTIATHSIVGGALSVAQGGSFESGALSAGISAGVGGIAGAAGLGDLGNSNTLIARTAIAAITGGTVSALTGGKFANGAITAAMALLYNEARHQGSPGTQSGWGEQSMDEHSQKDAIHETWVIEGTVAGVAGPIAAAARGMATVSTAGMIDSAAVRYTQDSIGRTFRNSQSIFEFAEGLWWGTIDYMKVAAIRVFQHEGRLYSMDNRRLWAFKQTGLKIPYRWATPSEVKSALSPRRFTTTNEGTSIRIRGGETRW